MVAYDTDLNIESNEVIANKKSFSTSEGIYRKIYMGQLLEMSKLAISFLFSHLLLKLLDNTILKYYIKYPWLYSILIIFMSLGMLLLAGSIFTYVKITNEKDDFLNKLI